MNTKDGKNEGGTNHNVKIRGDIPAMVATAMLEQAVVAAVANPWC